MTMRDENVKDKAVEAAGSTVDAVEQRMMAFAEQLGRVVGTVQAKAEGWLDRDALNAQVAQVRDSAAELLEQLSGKSADRKGVSAAGAERAKPAAKGAKPAAKSAPTAKSGASKKSGRTAAKPSPSQAKAKGRSGGVVDAPGKRHRKPTPNQSVAKSSDPHVTQLRVASANRTRRRR